MTSRATQSAQEGFIGNRTGIQTRPEYGKELIEGANRSTPSSDGSAQAIAVYRGEYISAGIPIGSLPPVRAAQSEEQAASTAVFLDKLSERLAFERMGTRLYEALINKVQILGEPPVGPSLSQLKEIHEEELKHFLLLQRVITELGGDPTVQSPSADVVGVASLGIVQVLTDPRTSISQALQGMLTAELVDNDCWQMLINLAASLGYTDLASEFETALDNEEAHLDNVRTWLSAQVMARAGAA
jgi:bacterioferritin (cytochrome b1)